MRDDQKIAWEEFKLAIKGSFKSSPVASLFFAIFSILYLISYCYNNLQNPDLLFQPAWFFDVAILSWTNLFIVPLILLMFPWKGKPKDYSDIKFLAKFHLLSPLAWIFGYILIKLTSKLYLICLDIIGTFLNWLAS
jgi:hypothetical protein